VHTQWITSSTGLPHEGQHVEFMLDGRDVAMEGAYVRQIFRTRWTGYDIERVRTWRSAGSDACSSLTANVHHPLLSLVATGHDSTSCGERLSGEGFHVAQSAHADLSVGQTPSATLRAGSRRTCAPSIAA
jgi:hypothetical protein